MSLEKEQEQWIKVSQEGNKEHYVGKPSDKEIKLYEKLLQKYCNKGVSILILGATSCLRDICLDLSCKLTVVDMNKEVIEILKNL